MTVSHSSHGKTEGTVLTCGEGDVGQLGLGPGVMERMRAGFVKIPDPVVEVCAGGMHTVCLTNKGQVKLRLSSLACMCFEDCRKSIFRVYCTSLQSVCLLLACVSLLLIFD